MKCSYAGEVKLWDAKYGNYLCFGTTSFFRRLALLVLHSKFITYTNGILILEFHTIEPYVYEEKRLRFKKLAKLLKKAEADGTVVVRYAFLLGPLIQVLTPESDVFKKIFMVEEVGMSNWILLGKQAVKYVDGVIMLFGIEKATTTLKHLLDCTVKKYLEEAVRK